MKKIYLAGKIARHDWRHSIVPDLENTRVGRPIPCDGFTYVGPYFSEDAMHGITHGANTHGAMWDDSAYEVRTREVRVDTERLDVARRCLKEIASCDVLFAWLTDTTAYGTLVEIGYAAGLKKQVVIASTEHIATPSTYERGHSEIQVPGHLGDLWFAVSMANVVVEAATAESALLSYLDHVTPKVDPALALLESPIEKQFWQQHTALKLPALTGLVPQHPVMGGKYRLDFALPAKHLAIELDGYEYHSTKQAFVKDRARQRDLEAAGWRVIRFAGSEVFGDAAACVRQAAALAAR